MERKGCWEMKLEGKMEMKWNPRKVVSRLCVDRERIEVENQEARLELRLDNKYEQSYFTQDVVDVAAL